MRYRPYWMHYFEKDSGGGSSGGTGSTTEKEGQSDGQDNLEDDPEGDESEKSAGGQKEDVTGLKSALEKERIGNKALKSQLSELKKLVAEGTGTKEELKTLRRKVSEYEWREQRDAAVETAIKEATKDGKFEVDPAKASKLAGLLKPGSDEKSLKDEVKEIVEALKVEKGKGELKKPLRGQPEDKGHVTKYLSRDQWAALQKSDPEAYKAMVAERRKNKKFQYTNS